MNCNIRERAEGGELARPPRLSHSGRPAGFANSVRVSIKGSSYARFRRALETGNLTLVRAAAAELPSINLDDALRVCLLLRRADARLYERATVRSLGRLAAPGCSSARDAPPSGRRLSLPDDPEAAQRELVALIRR